MDVTVTTHRPSNLEEQEAHRIAEGFPSPEGPTHKIPNALNIEQIHNDPDANWRPNWEDKYRYPEIRVTDTTGETHVFDHAIVNIEDTAPEVDIWMVHDETASNEHTKVTYYRGYGIQSSTFVNSFGTECVAHSVFIKTPDGKDVVLSPCSYRGFIVKYSNGTIRTVGNIERHSRTAQSKQERNPPQEHPYATDDGYITVSADGETYHGIVNVSRPEPSEYVLHTAVGNQITVSDITDVDGALYTVVARHTSTFGHGVTTTGVQRALGVYVDENPRLSSTGEPELKAIGHPNSAAVHKTPSAYRIAALSDIKTGFVKTPSGKVMRSFDSLLRR